MASIVPDSAPSGCRHEAICYIQIPFQSTLCVLSFRVFELWFRSSMSEFIACDVMRRTGECPGRGKTCFKSHTICNYFANGYCRNAGNQRGEMQVCRSAVFFSPSTPSLTPFSSSRVRACVHPRLISSCCVRALLRRSPGCVQSLRNPRLWRECGNRCSDRREPVCRSRRGRRQARVARHERERRFGEQARGWPW